jgi:hypothetical protein
MKNASGKRYDLFNFIHKGIRAMLYNTGLAIQHHDFSNRKDTPLLLTKITEALMVLNDHALHERKFILPLVAKYNLQAVRDLDSDQLAVRIVENRLKERIALFNNCSDADSLECSESICKAFNQLIACYTRLANLEEETLNRILWQNYSDEEIFCIYTAITAALPAEKIMLHGRWIMQGLNNKEIMNWLLSYHGTSPEAFKCLLQMAEDELPRERWHNIKDSLCEGEMLPCGCDHNR